MTKKKLLLISVMVALALGAAAGFFAISQRPVQEKQIPVARPVDEEAGEPSHALKAAPVTEEDSRKPDLPDLGVRPAGTGEAFDIGTVENSGFEEVAEKIGPRQDKGDFLDSVNPRIRDIAEQTKELVDEFDRKTLEVTADILGEIPLIELKPDKAKLRPKGDGLELTIEIPPETIRLKKNDGTRELKEDDSADSGQ